MAGNTGPDAAWNHPRENHIYKENKSINADKETTDNVDDKTDDIDEETTDNTNNGKPDNAFEKKTDNQARTKMMAHMRK
eukprot:6059950-Ditylum_brightwellii.AAC.1